MSRDSSRTLQGDKGRDVGLKGTELKVEPSLVGKGDASTTLYHVPQTDLELAAKHHCVSASETG